MARFYFHVLDGVTKLDEEGTELPSWREARLEAVRMAGELIRDDAERVSLGEHWHLEVTDHAGLLLFRMDFMILESPMMQHAKARAGELS